jgi:hypothetical protein
MSSSNASDRDCALAALRAVEANAGDVAEIDESAIRALLTSAVRLYAARVERAGSFAGVERGAIAATDALVTASTLLKSVNVAPFELGLWDAWS